MRQRWLLVAVVTLGAVLLMAGAASARKVVVPPVDPADFVTEVTNPYFPLVPGTTHIYEGDTRDGFEHVESTVTFELREILGITCTVVHELSWLDDELVEETFDWYAQDTDGNVWYFGEATTEFVDGEPVSTEGSWEAGVDGAEPGIIMLANPRKGDAYRQEFLKGVAEDWAKVIGLNRRVTVPYGSFTGVLKTKEWTKLERGFIEHKFYAPGIGLVEEVGLHGGFGRIELVDIVVE